MNDGGIAALRRQPAGAAVAFELLEDTTLTGRLDGGWTNPDGSRVHWGSIPDPRGTGSFTLSVSREGVLRASFETPEGRYAILPTGGGDTVHAALRIGGTAGGSSRPIGVGTDRPAPDINPLDTLEMSASDVAAAGSEGTRRHRRVTAHDPAVVRILVAYTTLAERRMRSLGASPESEIRHLVDRTNTSLTASHTHTKLELAGTVRTAYVESEGAAHEPGGMPGIAIDLLELSCESPRGRGSLCAEVRLGIGAMTRVRRERARHKADLVHLLTGRDYAGMMEDSAGTIGVAWAVRSYPMFVRTAGYAVSEYLLTPGTEVFSHETGHNFGLGHDRYTAIEIDGDVTARTFARPERYAFGYVNRPGVENDSPLRTRWRTIMSYDQECYQETEHVFFPSINGYCRAINRFSHPDLGYNGDPTGSRTGANDALDGPADAARAIRRAARYVAAYY